MWQKRFYLKKLFCDPEFEKNKLKYRLCPDIEKDDEAIKLLNLYFNEEYRSSFNFIGTKCKPEKYKCKSE